MWRRLLLSLACIGMAACGGGSDGLSDVVGPNPISDARGIWSALHDDGWSDAQVAEFRGFLQGLGVPQEDVRCLVEEVSDRFTAEEFSRSTGEEPEMREALAACGYAVP